MMDTLQNSNSNEGNPSREDKPALVRLNKKKILSYAISILIVILGYISTTAPTNFLINGTFTIEQGQNLKIIASGLEEKSFIRSSIIFVSFVELFGGDRNIEPGDYYFPERVSAITIAYQMSNGVHNTEPVKITVPEGRNSMEISEILSEKIAGFDKQKFAEMAKKSEGYLFPETYFFYPSVSNEEIISSMRLMFEQKTRNTFKNIIGEKERKDTIILASLVEREAHGDDDRAIIAGILANRLSAGMPLQVDATVAYARGVSDNLLKKSDMNIDSPFNTYRVKGLPPAPIANPGIIAINAVLSPTKTSFLYYLHDKKGVIHYAKTYREHQINITKYLR